MRLIWYRPDGKGNIPVMSGPIILMHILFSPAMHHLSYSGNRSQSRFVMHDIVSVVNIAFHREG